MSTLLGYVDADTLAGECEKPRRSSGGWIVKCPSHEDRSASLSIHDGKRGTVLNCHAGCSVGDIADKLGFKVAQLFEDYDTTGEPSVNIDLLMRGLKEKVEPPKLRQGWYTINNIVDLAFKGTVEDAARMHVYAGEYMETEFNEAMKMWNITADVVVFPYMERYWKESGRPWFDIRDEAMKALARAYKEEMS